MSNTDVNNVGYKVTAILEKFDGEGTDPNQLVERIHFEGDDVDSMSAVKVEYFDNGEKTGEESFDEGGTT
jgi:hypothetical protein